MAFLTVNNFFCAFSNIPTNITFLLLIFLKLNQSQNMMIKIYWGFFFKYQKKLFQGLKMVPVPTFQKWNLKFVFIRLFFNENIDIWPPWNFFKMKTLTHVRRRERLKFGFGLWLVDLFWPIKQNFHTPPYCTVKKMFYL